MADILVVDDSLSMRHMVSLTLTEANYNVTVAEDGVQGLERAREAGFDLVITDVNMPNMDGLTLVKEIRGLPNYKYTLWMCCSTPWPGKSAVAPSVCC